MYIFLYYFYFTPVHASFLFSFKFTCGIYVLPRDWFIFTCFKLKFFWHAHTRDSDKRLNTALIYGKHKMQSRSPKKKKTNLFIGCCRLNWSVKVIKWVLYVKIEIIHSIRIQLMLVKQCTHQRQTFWNVFSFNCIILTDVNRKCAVVFSFFHFFFSLSRFVFY